MSDNVDGWTLKSQHRFEACGNNLTVYMFDYPGYSKLISTRVMYEGHTWQQAVDRIRRTLDRNPSAPRLQNR